MGPPAVVAAIVTTAVVTTPRVVGLFGFDTATEQVTRELRERLHHEISEPALEALSHFPSSAPAHGFTQ